MEEIKKFDLDLDQIRAKYRELSGRGDTGRGAVLGTSPGLTGLALGLALQEIVTPEGVTEDEILDLLKKRGIQADRGDLVPGVNHFKVGDTWYQRDAGNTVYVWSRDPGIGLEPSGIDPAIWISQVDEALFELYQEGRIKVLDQQVSQVYEKSWTPADREKHELWKEFGSLFD